MRENLVDGASGHDVAAQEQPDQILSALLVLPAFRTAGSQSERREADSQLAQSHQEMATPAHAGSVCARMLCAHACRARQAPLLRASA
jgi:hypothetical protein